MKVNNIEVFPKTIKEENVEKIILNDGTNLHLRTKNIKKDGSSYIKFVTLRKHPCKYCSTIIYVEKDKIKNNRNIFCNTHCNRQYYRRATDPQNEIIFDKINTPEFYHLIGLLCTDGTIIYPSKDNKYKSYRIRIHIHIDDKNILKLILKTFGGRLDIDEKYCMWELNNRKFVEYLRDEIGLTTKKSLTLNIEKWFNKLDDDDKSHFIRGVFDGDGCISKAKRNNDFSMSIISASIHFFEMIYNYMKRFKNIKIRIQQPKPLLNKMNPLYSILFYGKNILEPLQFIYNGSMEFKIERKFERFKQALQRYYNGSTVAPSG